MLDLLFKSHPWHGVPIGEAAPERVTVYVEMVPTDTVKYELDKDTGLLKVDRPQKYSNVPPSLYGFVPRTLCAESVAALFAEKQFEVLDEIATSGESSVRNQEEERSRRLDFRGRCPGQ